MTLSGGGDRGGGKGGSAGWRTYWMTVHTNTFDHPRALALYQRMGFVPVRREEKTRKLTRAREV